MKRISLALSLLLSLLPRTAMGQTHVTDVGNGKVYQTTMRSGKYLFDRAEYAIFIPEGVKTIRGAFVHQHGCTMEGVGASTAFDIQYQALARKWGLAVVGPDLYPKPGRNCHDWRQPESGSADALMKALAEAGEASGHSELSSAPWLLWGHSGGGYWTLAMMRDYPERIIAAFAYSPAFDPEWDFPKEALRVPLMIRHAGPTDFNAPGVACWQTALNVFAKLRQRDGLVSLAYTPNQNHNLSHVRYMAIPFFESALARRLPKKPGGRLKEMNKSEAWLGDTLDYRLSPKTSFQGDKCAMNWLPDAHVAEKWREYCITGTIQDKTPPGAPYAVEATRMNDSTAAITWKAEADIESGIHHFNLRLKDGTLARFPAESAYQRFDTNGDNTLPIQPPALRYELKRPDNEPGTLLFISTVNHSGLESTFATGEVRW